MKNDNAVRCVVIFFASKNIRLHKKNDTIELYLSVRVVFFAKSFIYL